MKITRRKFLKMGALAGGATLLPMPVRWLGRNNAFAFSRSIPLLKFVQPLRSFGAGIPVAQSIGTYANMDDYRVIAGVFRDQLHPNLPNATRLYGYGSQVGYNGQLVNARHLGHAIIAKKGRPVRLKLSSALLASHIIPFDASISMPQTGNRQDRAALHLHGGLVPWASDGGPFHWYSNPANNSSGLPTIGPSQIEWLPDDDGDLTDDYYYPNHQSSRFMWYHDHAIGTTRTSAYAGLASGYLLMDPDDPVEQQLAATGYSPTELLLVFQDKIFWDPISDPGYATHITGAVPGDLWYPYLYERAIFKIQGPGGKLPIPSAIPEFFGDTMLVNGLVYPYKDVKPGAHRIRTLNACNARFLNLSFVFDDGAGEPAGGYLAPTPAPVDVWVIGTEGGFLPAPVQIFKNGVPLGANGAPFVPTPTNPGPWLNGPAERVDLLVNFSQCAGRKVMLYNDAQAPFPGGAPASDYYPGAPKNPVITTPGSGPNSRTLMRFNVEPIGGLPVVLPSASAMQASNPVLPTAVDPLNGGLKLDISGSTYTHNGVQYSVLSTTQELTLNEAFDAFGRLEQLIGTNVPLVKGTFGRTYLDPPTEFIQYKTIQIWNIYNLSADTHPMHVHEFNAMILRRRPFKVTSFNGAPSWTGPGRGPDPGEEGWKETFRMNSGECTTIAILVEDPLPGRKATVVSRSGETHTGTLPYSPRLAAMGIEGDEYVWHCHILEHEEHDMMRPLVAGP